MSTADFTSPLQISYSGHHITLPLKCVPLKSQKYVYFYVFLNLNFKLRHVDFYYLRPIATTILTLNLKVNLKFINNMSIKKYMYCNVDDVINTYVTI